MTFSVVQPYTYTLEANGRQAIAGVGSVVAVAAASGDFTLEVDQQTVVVKQGYIIRANPGQSFGRLSIVNGSLAQTVTVYVGDGDITLPIPSVVEVVDGGKEISVEGRAFMGVGNQGNTAAEYGHVQLFNPVANVGRRAIVTSIVGSLVSAGTLSLAMYDTALTTAEATVGSKDQSGSIATTMEVRKQTDASVLGDYRAIVNLSSADPYEFDLDEPFILYPGDGICVTSGSPNIRIRGTFQYIEEVY